MRIWADGDYMKLRKGNKLGDAKYDYKKNSSFVIEVYEITEEEYTLWPDQGYWNGHNIFIQYQ